jgi:methylase of polypeptide subunit release factors
VERPASSTVGVPDAGDRGALRGLRAALEAARYTTERVEERLGTHELSARPADVAVHLRRLEQGDAFDTLARLFLLGAELPAPLVDAATAPIRSERLASLGIVSVAEGRVRALVRIAPHGEYFLASDAGPESGSDVPHDHVPGVQSPSVTLAKLTVRRPVRSALDLGTGCGIQALLAARHAERVVATDVNPRALAFASLNAELNGAGRIELRLGDGFEPVEGELFDLIVANPPYVISPDSAYAYRDSGRPADELCREVVASAARHLRENGLAHVLVSWALRGEDDWSAPLRGWFAGSGCDAWLLHYRTSDPVAHAAGWLRTLGETDPAAHAEALDRWLGHLDADGIEAVAYGAVVLRRRAGARNWIRADPLPLEKLEPAGEHTLRVFAAQNLLQELGDEGLLDVPLALTEHHRLEQSLVVRDGGLVVEAQVLELTDGLRFTVGVDRHTVSLLPHFDGARPLREVLDRARGTFELEPEEQDRFVPAALPVVMRLLELGFLEAP